MKPLHFLFDLNHPAHVHLFRPLIGRLLEEGRAVTVMAADVPILKSILEYHQIPYVVSGQKGKSLRVKFLRQLQKIIFASGQLKNGHLNIGTGVSVALPVLGAFSPLHTIVLDDDDKKATPVFAAISHTLASVVLRPSALLHEKGHPRTVYYNGYHELAYLHPAQFSPDRAVLPEQGLAAGEPFFILRLVALKAHHDRGVKGLNKDDLERITGVLRPYGRIFVSSEEGSRLPEGLEPIRVHPARIHHLMAFARMVVSDGQTMCSEAACLGVPSVRINDFAGRISYLQEQEEKWQLTFGFRPDELDDAIVKMKEVLSAAPEVFGARRDLMVKNSIRVSDFLYWFVSNFPESRRTLLKQPDYLLHFI
jgi:hypothetical protein